MSYSSNHQRKHRDATFERLHDTLLCVPEGKTFFDERIKFPLKYVASGSTAKVYETTDGKILRVSVNQDDYYIEKLLSNGSGVIKESDFFSFHKYNGHKFVFSLRENLPSFLINTEFSVQLSKLSHTFKNHAECAEFIRSTMDGISPDDAISPIQQAYIEEYKKVCEDHFANQVLESILGFYAEFSIIPLDIPQHNWGVDKDGNVYQRDYYDNQYNPVFAARIRSYKINEKIVPKDSINTVVDGFYDCYDLFDAIGNDEIRLQIDGVSYPLETVGSGGFARVYKDQNGLIIRVSSAVSDSEVNEFIKGNKRIFPKIFGSFEIGEKMKLNVTLRENVDNIDPAYYQEVDLNRVYGYHYSSMNLKQIINDSFYHPMIENGINRKNAIGDVFYLVFRNPRYQDDMAKFMMGMRNVCLDGLDYITRISLLWDVFMDTSGYKLKDEYHEKAEAIRERGSNLDTVLLHRELGNQVSNVFFMISLYVHGDYEQMLRPLKELIDEYMDFTGAVPLDMHVENLGHIDYRIVLRDPYMLASSLDVIKEYRDAKEREIKCHTNK